MINFYLEVVVENTAPPYFADKTVVFVNVTLIPEVKNILFFYSYSYYIAISDPES